MAIIQSDNPGIEKHLIRLEELIEEGGGGLHSQLVIDSQGGNLAVRTKEKMAPGREIIRLTRDVLLPDDQYDVAVKGDEFTLSFPAKSLLSDLQKRLIETMIALYNETDKVALHKKYSFLLSMKDYPEVLDILEEAREFPKHLKEWRPKVEAGLSEADMSEFIAKTFLKTRHLGYTDHIRVINVSILMPVVDFLNHHWVGSAFNVVRGVRKGDLTVGSSQPVEGSTECFAFYGTMDALDSLVRYDFLDTSAPFVRSVPMMLDVLDMGRIKITAPAGGMNKKKLADDMVDLLRYMPNMRMEEGSDVRQLNLSHAIIPPAEASPRALRRVLKAALKEFIGNDRRMSPQQVRLWMQDSERQIVEANVTFYQRLLQKVEAETAAKGKSEALGGMKVLAENALGLLSRYAFLEKQDVDAA